MSWGAAATGSFLRSLSVSNCVGRKAWSAADSRILAHGSRAFSRDRSGMRRLRTLVGLISLIAALGGRAALLRAKPRIALATRLRNIPTADAPTTKPVRIRWNDHQVPFIEAECDEDVAVGLGVVHAHLRLAQIELMRRAAYGRTAELIGPVGIELDRFLRTMDFIRAVPAMEATLPAETRAWLEGFAAGLNHVIAQAPAVPPEFRVLRVRPQPWTVTDLLAIGRLASADFTWRMWFGLLRHRRRPEWLKLWSRMVGNDAAPLPSFAGGAGSIAAGTDPGAALMDGAVAAFGRAGSNSFAVSAGRSKTGAALMASDPHLPIVLPNLWLIAGYRSPSYHVVGLMIPGVPAMALGRNRWIAWGGTSLHAASSELFDVGDLADHEFHERRETIRVRWWPDQTVIVREAPMGPVITDAGLLRAEAPRPLALRWVGHQPSDEMTALLKVNRARSWAEFREALESFAVPAQNMICADGSGGIGQAMAAHLPRRPTDVPKDMVVPREAHLHWEDFVTGHDLPAVWNPPEGFVASANNRPPASDVPVGFFFSSEDRIRRLRTLLGGDARIGVQQIVAIHHDVLVPSAQILRDAILDVATHLPPAVTGSPAGRTVLDPIARWDGRYDATAPGALAFESLLYHFVQVLNGSEDMAVYAAFSDPWLLVREDLQTVERPRLVDALQRALPATARVIRRYGTWGAAHRLRLQHMFARLPLIGRRHVLVDAAVSGGNDTVMKTAHGFAPKRHAVRYGANARHISDLADLDANYAVLLGGQDGWIGSTTVVDQYALWRRREMISLPLRPEKVAAGFPHLTVLQPGPTATTPAAVGPTLPQRE
ncbi:MAG: penicillin acylase family protein [Rhodospirillales bacterium]|nr:MAG: penicillin acylase family protein [Rhodospirillales bacterium]